MKSIASRTSSPSLHMPTNTISSATQHTSRRPCHGRLTGIFEKSTRALAVPARIRTGQLAVLVFDEIAKDFLRSRRCQKPLFRRIRRILHHDHDVTKAKLLREARALLAETIKNR